MLTESRCLELNVMAGRAQVEVLEYLNASLPAGLPPEDEKHFKNRLLLLLHSTFTRMTDDIRVAPEKDWLTKMTPREYACFSRVNVTFGKHMSRSVGEIDSIDRQYLEWLADSGDDFKKSLKRWLLGPKETL